MPGAAEASIRNLPPSGLGGPESGFNAQELLDSNKGAALSAIVEAVRDGSTLRVLLLPSFQYVQVYLAGVQVSGWVWRFIEWLPLVSNGGYSLD